MLHLSYRQTTEWSMVTIGVGTNYLKSDFINLEFM